ncbi:MAG: hypothetical protein AB7V23_13835 [Candidatus Nanopelagicales bacterium]
MNTARDTARTVVPPLLAACVVALIVGDPGQHPQTVTIPNPQVAAVGH